MAVKWTEAVWGLELTATQMSVAQALADFAHKETGLAWPRQELLAWKTRLSKKTVGKTLRELVEIGLFDRVRPANWHAPACYRFNPHHSIPKAPKPVSEMNQLPPLGEKDLPLLGENFEDAGGKSGASEAKSRALRGEAASTKPLRTVTEPSSTEDDVSAAKAETLRLLTAMKQ